MHATELNSITGNWVLMGFILTMEGYVFSVLGGVADLQLGVPQWEELRI